MSIDGSPERLTAGGRVANRALPFLLEQAAFDHNWPQGHSVEEYLWPGDLPVDGPIRQLDNALDDLTYPHARNIYPDQRHFTLRNVRDPGNGDYGRRAHLLELDDFVKKYDGNWMYYVPVGTTKGPTVNRTYLSLHPYDDTAIDDLLVVGQAAEDNLQGVNGVNFKVSRYLDEVHSIVIFDDGTEIAVNGLTAFVRELEDHPYQVLDPECIRTALPISPGIGRAPEPPKGVVELYRQKINDPTAPLSWSTLAGAMLRVAAQYSLCDIEPVRVRDNFDKVLAKMMESGPAIFNYMLNGIGVDPVSFRQKPAPIRT